MLGKLEMCGAGLTGAFFASSELDIKQLRVDRHNVLACVSHELGY